MTKMCKETKITCKHFTLITERLHVLISPYLFSQISVFFQISPFSLESAVPRIQCAVLEFSSYRIRFSADPVWNIKFNESQSRLTPILEIHKSQLKMWRFAIKMSSCRIYRKIKTLQLVFIVTEANEAAWHYGKSRFEPFSRNADPFGEELQIWEILLLSQRLGPVMALSKNGRI